MEVAVTVGHCEVVQVVVGRGPPWVEVEVVVRLVLPGDQVQISADRGIASTRDRQRAHTPILRHLAQLVGCGRVGQNAPERAVGHPVLVRRIEREDVRVDPCCGAAAGDVLCDRDVRDSGDLSHCGQQQPAEAVVQPRDQGDPTFPPHHAPVTCAPEGSARPPISGGSTSWSFTAPAARSVIG